MNSWLRGPTGLIVPADCDLPIVTPPRIYSLKAINGTLVGWWNFDLPNVTLSSGKISGVTDLSGAGAFGDLAQASGSLQPTHTAGAQQGQYGATFSGAQCLVSANTYAPTSFTIFCAFRASGTAGMIWERSADANANDGEWLFGTNGTTLMAHRGSLKSSPTLGANWSTSPANTNRVVRVQEDGTYAGHKIFFNNVDQGATGGAQTQDVGTAANTAAKLFVGARNQASFFMTGVILELAVFSPILSDAQAQLASRAYFAPKFGMVA